MGEFASGIATTLLGKLANSAYQEIVSAWGLGGDVKRLRDSMSIIKAFLIDAENKQFTNQSITEWLQQLRDAFYEASDILDEIECEAKINEIVKTNGRVPEKLRRCFSGSNPLVFRFKMAHKIKDIKRKIDEIASNRNRFGLTEQQDHNDMPFNQNLPLRETHSSLPSCMTGRDKEKKEILSFLNSSPLQSQVKNIDVIPIVAMGGWGKTTLAQLVYNDESVKGDFDLQMWVHVSQDFNVKIITSKILKAADRTLSGGDVDKSSLEQLKTTLKEKLCGKRFLLVLDDVWNENAKRWHDLRDILLDTSGKENKIEGKIIVTTRSRNVASTMKTVSEINLEQLPHEECLKLFIKCAFHGGEEEAEQHPRLKEIGEEIVEKCKGVPLAVVTLGCLLNSQHDEKEWKKILNSQMWGTDHQKDDDILPALRLSYYHLPSHLKQCFAYCAIFPKGYLFTNFDLIPFWMAHGLLQPTSENEEPEYLGELYFKQLISRSFFQPHESWDDEEIFNSLGIYYYRMHDLVHDLAISIMSGEIAKVTSDTTFVNEKVRLLSISNNERDRVGSLCHKLKKVRSFTAMEVTEAPFMKMISKEFKYLRVLNLQDSGFKSLLDCFSKMKHLRYLHLGGCTELEELPSSICKLYNLQILIFWGCYTLQELPRNMRNLVNLRILYITAQVRDLSHIDISCFRSLQILSIVECPNLVILPCDLGHLTTLKKLVVTDCENLARFEDEDEDGGGRKQKEGVKDLSLQEFVFGGAPKLTSLPNWLERSANTLQRIVIEGTGLTAFPDWLPKLTSLDTFLIGNCQNLTSLPKGMNHLRSLQHLHIVQCPDLRARYEKDEGPEWREIAHVPDVRFW